MFNDIKRLPNPPETLNILGKLTKGDEKSLVVIGSRRMTSYGKNVIDSLIPELVKKGFTIVSGLAPGCDSYAQQTALASGGRTIGVLGYGLGNVKNDSNQVFIKKVLNDKSGVVISPFKRNQRPTRESFIFRNSVMSAIGQGVLIIEAARRSGVFHTVNFGLELGKDIMVVPGDIFRLHSAGVHALIKEGAHLVDGVKDILRICDE